MGVYYLIFAFFAVFMIVNYKKALYLWAVVSLAMHIGICIKFTPPNISLLFLVNITFLLYSYRHRIKKNNAPFALHNVLKYTVISTILTAVFLLSFSAAYKELITAFNTIVGIFTVLYLLDKEIETSEDIHSICKVLFLFISISIIYGVYTIVTVSNPIIEWEQSFIPESMSNKLVDSTETYRGVKAQSFFGGATQFAAFVYMTAIVFLAIKMKNAKRLTSVSIIVLIIAVMICFLSKTRASIFAALCATLYLVYKQNATTKMRIFMILLLFLPIVFPFFAENISFLTSIYDTRAQDDVGGSSMEMRLIQARIVGEIFSSNPLFGLGTTGAFAISNMNIDGLYGAESVWFHLLINRGLIGVLVYLYIFYYTVKSISRERRTYMIMAAIFWLTLHTLSTTGLSEYFYLFVFLLLKKLDDINLKEKI